MIRCFSIFTCKIDCKTENASSFSAVSAPLSFAFFIPVSVNRFSILKCTHLRPVASKCVHLRPNASSCVQMRPIRPFASIRMKMQRGIPTLEFNIRICRYIAIAFSASFSVLVVLIAATAFLFFLNCYEFLFADDRLVMVVPPVQFALSVVLYRLCAGMSGKYDFPTQTAP